MKEVRKAIMITGAAGALAKKTISKLKKDYNIIAVDFREKVDLESITASYKVDFNKRIFEDIFREHKIDGVIHLGRISASESNRYNRYNANVRGTKKLLDLCRKYEVHQVIVLSTYFVYGASPYNPSLLDEKTPIKAADLTMDMVDSVELDNLANIYLYKHPELNITILRPCNIAGPWVRNTFSKLLASKSAPVLWGFSPLMQFIHIDDMKDAICAAFYKNIRGLYNVAPSDYIGFQDAVRNSGCKMIQIPSVPPGLTMAISKAMKLNTFPPFLLNYYRYPVIIDGSLFEKTFDFKPQKTLDDIFSYYRDIK